MSGRNSRLGSVCDNAAERDFQAEVGIELSDKPTEIESIVLTASRIRVQDYQAPTPAMVVDQRSLECNRAPKHRRRASQAAVIRRITSQQRRACWRHLGPGEPGRCGGLLLSCCAPLRSISSANVAFLAAAGGAGFEPETAHRRVRC